MLKSATSHVIFKGYCCLDAPYELEGDAWGHKVSPVMPRAGRHFLAWKRTNAIACLQFSMIVPLQLTATGLALSFLV